MDAEQDFLDAQAAHNAESDRQRATESELDKAAAFIRLSRAIENSDEHVALQTYIAIALAAERAAIHARYEAVADEFDDAPDRDDMSEDWQDGRDEALLACSARIRQVAAQ